MSLHDWKFHSAVLNVPEHASLKEIKDAYRRLAQRYHPDHNAGTLQAKEKFQRINASYRYLTRNFAARPPVFEKKVAEAAAPPPSSRQEEPLRWGWRKKTDPKDPFLNLFTQRLSIFRAASLKFLAKKPVRMHLVAAAVLLFGTFALSVAFRQLNEKIDANNASAFFEVKPKDNVDSFGRVINRCDLLTFEKGNLVDRRRSELSQVDCGLKCYDWFVKNDTLDASCNWSGKEFEKHTANLEARNLASTASVPPQQSAFKPQGLQDENPFATIYADSVPYHDGPFPIETRKIKLGTEDRVNLPFVPMVYLEDTRLIHGNAGVNSRQIIVTPIRRGATSVFIVDPLDRPYRQIIYNIE